MTNTSTVAWYTLAYTWVSIPMFFPTLLATATFPTLSSQAANRSPDFSPAVNKALQLAVLVGTPIAVGIALIAPNIIALFHYPAEYHHSVVLIRILAIHIPIVALDIILANALMAGDRQKLWLVIGCVAAVFNTAVNLVAIPVTSRQYGNGAIGASIVTVATELLIMIGALLLRPTGVVDRRTVGFLLRTLLAGVAMIPTVLLVRNAPLAAKVAVGALTFAAASYGLGLVSPRMVRENVSQLMRSVGERERRADLSTQVDSQ
jgi:O-antigen/teichoic acid export membrane protein